VQQTLQCGKQKGQEQADEHWNDAAEEQCSRGSKGAAVARHGNAREGRSGTPDGASEKAEHDPKEDVINRAGVAPELYHVSVQTAACQSCATHGHQSHVALSSVARLHGADVGEAAAAVASCTDVEASRRSDEVQLNAEELAQYLEVVSQNDRLCLDKQQLMRDFKVYTWLVKEVQEQKGVLQKVPQSAAVGSEIISPHAEALREFDANHVVWFQKSKLMSLLYRRLKGAQNAVAAAKAQQHRRQGLEQ
jgi:hypothetical protein